MHPPSNNENRPPSNRTSATPSKMFSSLPPPHPQSSPFSFQYNQNLNQNFYTPSKPSPLSSSPLRADGSPLSERQNENPSYSFTMSSPPPQSSAWMSAQPSIVSSAKSTGKRVVKKNPLIHRDEKDGGRETRRKLFLKRVREESEDKRWDKKGGDDELLRSIYIADHKRSIGRNLREDATYEETPEDYHLKTDNSVPTMSQQPSITRPISPTAEQQMADEVARQEEAELQAYLEMMEAETSAYQQQQTKPQQQRPHQYQQQNTPHIQASASDDIDYDKMFDDMNMDGAQDTGDQGTGVPDDEDMMDMS